MKKELHDILLSRKEAKLFIKIWDCGIDSLTREERAFYAVLVDRLNVIVNR